MSRLSALRFAGCVVAVGVCLTVSGPVAPLDAAEIHYKATTRVVTDQRGAQPANSDVEAWVKGEMAKIVFAESDNPMAPSGTHLLTTDGAKTVYLVNDEEKTYSVWDIEAMLRLASNVIEAAGPMMSLEFSDPEVTKLLEEAAGEMHGIDVTHYRFRTTYDLRMKVLAMKRNQSVEIVRDVWSTDDYEDLALGLWLRNDGKTGNEELDKVIQAEFDTIRGFPLKSVNVQTTTDQKGRKTTSTTTTEVTLWEETSVSDDLFVLDPSYQQVVMPIPGATVEGGEGEAENPLAGLFGRRKKKN